MGCITEVIHLSLGVVVTVSMSGSPIPLSSLGVTKVLCAIGSTLWCLKNLKIAVEIVLMCWAVGVWNCAW